MVSMNLSSSLKSVIIMADIDNAWNISNIRFVINMADIDNAWNISNIRFAKFHIIGSAMGNNQPVSV